MTRFTITLVCSVLSATGALADETWRVAFSPIVPLVTTGEDGTPEGFAIEIMEHLARTAGARIDYIEFKNPGESLAAVERGDADIIPILSPSDERRAVAIFTEPFEWIGFSLYTLQDNPNRFDATWAEGSRIGHVSGAFTETIVSEIKAAAPVPFVNNEALMVALAAGEIDGAVFPEFTFNHLVERIGLRDRFVAVGPPLWRGPISIAVDRRNQALFDRIEPLLTAFVNTPEFTRLQADLLGRHDPAAIGPVLRARIFYGFAGVVLIAALLIAATWMRGRYRLLDAALARAREREEFNKRLQKMNAALEKRNQDMATLLYVATHDLKSPLVSIAGFARRVRRALDEGTPEKVDRALDRIASNVHTMGDLIDGILEFNKIDKRRAECAEVNLDDIIEQVRSALQSQLDACGARLHADPLPVVWSDGALLRRALQNLIENAARHGCVQPGMTIEILHEHRDGSHAIGVRDHGPGVAEEHRERIFQMFQQLSNRSQGNGLGLMIARKIAHSLGGQAWVESEPGLGATFWISFEAEPSLKEVDSAA